MGVAPGIGGTPIATITVGSTTACVMIMISRGMCRVCGVQVRDSSSAATNFFAAPIGSSIASFLNSAHGGLTCERASGADQTLSRAVFKVLTDYVAITVPEAVYLVQGGHGGSGRASL